MGPTIDIAITRAVLTRFLAASTRLSQPADADLVTRARAALDRLPAYRITHDGRLQEWPEDYADHEPGHRHISHLFGLFPEDQISLESTPELAQAARMTLDKRLAAGSGSTGWSRSWIINCIARLQDGDAAYQNILELIRLCTRHNLFDVCGLKENSPYQIDGNLGAPTGFIEMLLQSQSGVIRLLPALPKAWPNGSFRGLRARNGAELDLEWKNNRATQATLRAASTHTHTIIPPKNQKFATIRQGTKQLTPKLDEKGRLSLPAQKRETYTLTFS